MQDVAASATALPALRAKLSAATAALAKAEKEAGPPSARAAVSPPPPPLLDGLVTWCLYLVSLSRLSLSPLPPHPPRLSPASHTDRRTQRSPPVSAAIASSTKAVLQAGRERESERI